jgi:tetratricopeptide (TPR) repeat protein
LAVCVLLAAPAAWAQAPAETGPTPPSLRPPKRADLDRREAQRLYARALIQERDSRLIEAIESLEKAVRLDPESALLRRALVPLYLAVDRSEDALMTCRKALDLEPGDYETWYLYARQFKLQNRTQDAISALNRAAACPGLKDRPEMRLQVHFDLGVLHENAQEFGKAAAAFGEVVQLLEKGDVPAADQADPGSLAVQAAETYERLGRVCVRAKEFERAIAAYRKAQEKDPQRRGRLSYNLADVYAGQGKLAEALASLDEYLATQPQGTEAYEQKIDLLRRLGREADILPALKEHANIDSENLDLKLLVARECASAGRNREAEGRYQAVLQKSPTPEAYRGLFAVYRAQGRVGTVLEQLDLAVRQATPAREGQEGDRDAAARARAMLIVLRDEADLVRAILPLVQQRLEIHRGAPHRQTCRFLALLADRAHALEAAEALYRSCLDGAGAGPRLNESEVYDGLLHVLWQEHKYEAVVEVCRKGLSEAQATNLLVFHYDLGRALMRLGKTDEALAEANRAVDIATKDEHRLQMRCFRASLLALAGRNKEAEEEAQALLADLKGRNRDEVLEVRYTLSEVYSQAKLYPQAEEQLRLILREQPKEARAHNDLGYLWADQGKNLEEAEKLIREALDLDREQKKSGANVEANADQENAAYVDSLGWVLFRRGRVEAARAEMDKACRLPDGADDPVVWDHAGDVYYKLGQADRARSAWRKAVELYGGTGRRRADDRLKDIEHKLKLLEPAAPPR